MPRYDPQSGTAEGVVTTGSKDLNAKSVRFKDRVEPYAYEIQPSTDSTRMAQDDEESPLSEFFARPVKIAEYEWGTGVLLAEDFNPWSLFFNQPRVINRLTNFNLLRANLRLRVLLNGNSFQYGRTLMYYRPLAAFDELSSNAAPVTQDLIPASQCPHLYLDPNTSQGGELLLPFFWHKNYFHIPDADWQNAGQVYLRSLNALKHANDASDVVTITIMAWCEDIHLSVLSSVDAASISPQAGEIEEANNKGYISGPATMVSKVAGALSSIPYIRPYALASQAVADSVSKVARIFGYCKPTITAAPTPYRPTPTSSLALTNVPDNSQKLTVDHKQEVTIDPSISGIKSADPFNILSIAQRESYLTTFSWNVGTAPDSHLWNARVSPLLWDESGGTAFHFTPMAVAALPFQKWKGSIKFRFQIVASSFHRGRLRIVWDPNYILDPSTNFNVVNSTIVDISEEKDFTVEIANGQEFTFLEHLAPGINALPYSSSAFTSLIRRDGIPVHNGVIGVYVLNELTVPNSTANNDIEINVFVSAGKDFEVAVPNDFFQRFSFKPQSGLIDDTMEQTSEPSKPIQDQSIEMHATSNEDDKANMVYMGEAVASLRPLLKRFNLHSSMGPSASGFRILAGTRPSFPYLRGNVTGAVNVTGTGAAYNYCNTVLLHWMVAPFQGWRGSTRWKIIPRGNYSASHPTVMYAARTAADTEGYYQATIAGQTNYTSPSSVATAAVTNYPYGTGDVQIMPSGVNGSAVTTAAVNSTLEVEMPYYSSYRFVPGKIQNYTQPDVSKYAGTSWFYRIVQSGEPSSVFDMHVAAGDDFQAFFWTGMPRVYYQPLNPSS